MGNQEPLTSDEFAELVMSVGTGRTQRHLSPVDTARRIQRALDYGVSDAAGLEKLSLATLTEKLGLKGPTMVTRFLNLLRLPSEFQELVGWGEGHGSLSHLTFSKASSVASLPPDQQRELLTSVLERELSKDETLAAVQVLRRDKLASVQEAVQRALATRPQITRHEVIIGEFPEDSPLVDPGLPTEKRTTALRKAVRSLVGDEQLAVRISGRNFVISTTSGGKAALDEHSSRKRKDLADLISQLSKDELNAE